MKELSLLGDPQWMEPGRVRVAATFGSVLFPAFA